jgi:hypothetical protein
VNALTPYKLWIELALVAAVIAALAWQRHTITGLRDTIAKRDAMIETYASANRTNQDAIKQYKAANEQWATRGIDVAKSDLAIDQVFAERDKLRKELAEAQSHREIIYVRDPNVRDWSNAGMPSDIADSMFPEKPNRPH